MTLLSGHEKALARARARSIDGCGRARSGYGPRVSSYGPWPRSIQGPGVAMAFLQISTLLEWVRFFFRAVVALEE